MKKLIIAAGFVLFVTAAKAQPPQPPGPPSIEERLKRTNEVIQQEVQLTTAQKTSIESTFKTFFTAEDKLRKDNPPPPPPPPDPKVKEAMDKLVKERDESIKKILTEAQYQKYKEAAKKLQPPKPGEKGKGGPPPPPQ
jgi:hypothetical protein